MFKSPLVLPLTLIFAGVLAFMATTGLLPAELLRFWPIVFVILGLIGLVSLSSDELMGSEMKKTSSSSASVKKAPAKAAKKPAAKKTAKKKKSR